MTEVAKKLTLAEEISLPPRPPLSCSFPPHQVPRLAKPFKHRPFLASIRIEPQILSPDELLYWHHRLAAGVVSPLRFTNPSSPSDWVEGSHLLAVEHAWHTKKGRPDRAAFSFGCGDGDSNPNALRRQNDNPLYRLIPAAGQNTLRTKVCQLASVVSEFGSTQRRKFHFETPISAA